jgi:hypothetical protein
MAVLGFKLPFAAISDGCAQVKDGRAQVKISGYGGDTVLHSFG